MKFSIIIPSYNAGQLIGTAIASVLSQSHQDWEILVIDNESTDDTSKIVAAICAADKRVIFHCMKDHGIYDAMNKGIDRVSGDYLYFMGADDCLHDNQVLAHVNLACENEADIIYGDVIWQPGGTIEKGEWSLQQLIEMNINHQRIFYKRSLFEDYGNYDIRYKIASDYQLNIRFFCNDKIRKKHINTVVADYNAYGFSANKTDVAFWENWKENVLHHFEGRLSKKNIYTSKSFYIRHLISQKKYLKAFRSTMGVFLHTFSFGFILLMIKFAIQSKKPHAA